MITSRVFLCVLGLAAAAACHAQEAVTDEAAVLRVPFDEAVEYRGTCDASAVVWLDDDRFVVANDEDNVLRVYHVGQPDALSSFALDGRESEVDIEAVATLGDRVYWLGSHGRDKRGRERPDRQQLFATRYGSDGAMEGVGKPYRSLLPALFADARYRRFDLAGAAARAPKSPGGLNFEGLVARSDGSLLVGLRSPVPAAGALLIPILNPRELVDGHAAVRLGDPLQLDLGGLGVRAIETVPDHGFLIAAGRPSGATERLFFWDETSATAPQPLADLTFNIEGIAYDEARRRVLLVSDDGTRSHSGTECKELSDPARRTFRAVLVSWPLGAPE